MTEYLLPSSIRVKKTRQSMLEAGWIMISPGMYVPGPELSQRLKYQLSEPISEDTKNSMLTKARSYLSSEQFSDFEKILEKI